MRSLNHNERALWQQQAVAWSSLKLIESRWNLMAHGDAREGKWRGNWRMEWVSSILHTTSEHGISSITTADMHTSTASSRLNWRPPLPSTPADLNGLVRFAGRLNLVSARVSSHFKRSLGLTCFRSALERSDTLVAEISALSPIRRTGELFPSKTDNFPLQYFYLSIAIYHQRL